MFVNKLFTYGYGDNKIDDWDYLRRKKMDANTNRNIKYIIVVLEDDAREYSFKKIRR